MNAHKASIVVELGAVILSSQGNTECDPVLGEESCCASRVTCGDSSTSFFAVVIFDNDVLDSQFSM